MMSKQGESDPTDAILDAGAHRRYKVRGPTAYRGAQYATMPMNELMDQMKRAQSALKLIETAERNPTSAVLEGSELVRLSRRDLSMRRLETLDLLTDLRAEIRRRGRV